MKNEFSLKYITLYPELFLNKTIDKTCCIIFAMIELLDGPKHCWASNKYFADMLNLSSTSVSTSISFLIKEGYIEKVSFDGRKRILKVSDGYKKLHKANPKEFNEKHSSFEEPNDDGSDTNSFNGPLDLPLRVIKGRQKEPLKDINNKIERENLKPFSKEKGRCLENTDSFSLEVPSQMEKDSTKKTFMSNQPDIPETINGKPSIVAIIAKNGKHSMNVEKPKPIRKLNRRAISESIEILESEEPTPSLSERASAGIQETCNKKAKPRKPKEQPLQIKSSEEDIAILIEHWGELEFKIHNPEKATVSYNKDIRALRKIKDGLLITGEKRKFNPEDIKTSMDRFALLIFNGEYGPSQAQKDHLSKISLCDFLYNPYMKTKSWFLNCLKEEPKKVEPIIDVPDLHPGITKRLQEHYKKYVFGEGLGFTPTPKEEANFRSAANWVCDYYDKRKHTFFGVNGGYVEMADILFECIKKQYGENIMDVHPGSFSSKYIHERMFAYMKQSGITQD